LLGWYCPVIPILSPSAATAGSVRANLVLQAKDWTWSGTNADLTGTGDALVCVEPMLEMFPD
jgi:hypothetical protein